MINALDVLDLVVTQVQAAEFCEGVETLDVRDEIVVQFEILQSSGERLGELNRVNRVLAQTQFLATVSATKLSFDVACNRP